MNITFLVGNGFDIRMGIASAYKKVEAHYVGIDKTDPVLVEFQHSLKNDGEYWSNFESAIGQYTGEFQEDGQADFQHCLNDFTEELILYLQKEESKIDYELCSAEIKKEFTRSFSNYDADIRPKYRNNLNSIINKHGGVSFRFISFNYTHILDQCLKQAFTKDTVVGKHVLGGTSYSHSVNGAVYHIHGALPGPIITGVDNSNQIMNKKWAEDRRFLQKLAKPAINDRAGSLIDENVLRLINESNIICVYGMSLGDTDQTWWKHIGSWLSGNDRRLILYGHDSGNHDVKHSYQRSFTAEDKLIDRFFDLADIRGASRDNLEKKVFAVINPNLFNLDLVKLTEQKKKVQKIQQETMVKQLETAFEEHQKLAKLTTIT